MQFLKPAYFRQNIVSSSNKRNTMLKYRVANIFTTDMQLINKYRTVFNGHQEHIHIYILYDEHVFIYLVLLFLKYTLELFVFENHLHLIAILYCVSRAFHELSTIKFERHVHLIFSIRNFITVCIFVSIGRTISVRWSQGLLLCYIHLYRKSDIRHKHIFAISHLF